MANKKVAKPKNKGGRPRFEVDYKTLDNLCFIHCTGEEIAAIMGVDYHTLNNALKRDGNKGFLQYYRIKSSGGKMSLRRRQFKKAIEEGNTQMLIWLGKQYLGQSDKLDNEELQEDLQPTKVEITVKSARKD